MDEEHARKDWAGSWYGLTLLWGVPSGIIAASAYLAPSPRGFVWTLMLLFMGSACLANARRCNRTHCRYTGPFLVLMALLVALYTMHLLPLGGNAWGLLASVAVGGSVILCCASEMMWGRYQR